MSGTEVGIRVEKIEGFNALKLICAHEISDHDLHTAGQQIFDALDRTVLPLHVVIDLTSKPEFPVGVTAYELLTGPVNHPMLGEVLIYGSSPSAHLVEDFVVFRGAPDAHWFDSEAEAMAFLQQISEEQDSE